MWLLHGFTGGGQDFEALEPHLPAGPHAAPDLIGHARHPARVPDDLSCYTMAACVASLVAAQMEATTATAGDKAQVVLGYSMGARVALSLAHARPELVRALILIGGTAGIEDAQEAAARRAADEALAAHIERVGVARFLEEWAKTPIIATQARVAPAWRARMEARRAGLSARGLAHSLRGMGTGAMPSLWGALGEVRCPTLLVTGEEDTKFCAIAARMAPRMPDARHVIIQGAGHAAHLEAPEATGAAICAFLAAQA